MTRGEERFPLVLPLVLLALCCGGDSSPTRGAEICRNYPLSFEENGVHFDCQLDQGAQVSLVCAGGAGTRRWDYASLGAFVDEVVVPNRPRWESRTTTAGVLLGSFTSTLRSYEYDGEGRASRRLRTSSGEVGSFDLDDTRYTEWDVRGRPTRGDVRSGSLTESISLVYDDARRRVETSTGEHVELDPNGNLVSEVEIFGLGPGAFRSERDYGATVTTKVCLP